MKELMMGGQDLMSPRSGQKPQNSKYKPSKHNLDDISGISLGTVSKNPNLMSSGMFSGLNQSMLMEDMSRMEGAFLSELNQAFAKKTKEEEKKEDAPKYEMVKKPAPQAKRQ
jgi:hypothetical protein